MSSAERSAGDDGIDGLIQRDIAEAVYEQRMPPGTRLSEGPLGTLYGVSRTVVRKALLRLASDQLVDMRPNRGAIVREPTVAEARDVFGARRLLEAALLGESVPRLGPSEHRRLRQLVDADRVAHDSQDRQQMIRASGAFHLALGAMAGNEALTGVLDGLIRRTSLIIALYEDRHAAPCAHHAHEDLLVVIQAGDVAGAREAMAAHLAECESRLALVPGTGSDDLSRMLGSPRRRPADPDSATGTA